MHRSDRLQDGLRQLRSGHIEFEVRGLVLARGNTIETPGAVNQMKGHDRLRPGNPPQSSSIRRSCRSARCRIRGQFRPVDNIALRTPTQPRSPGASRGRPLDDERHGALAL